VTYQTESEFAIQAALAAGENATRLRAKGISVEAKPDASPVTSADRDNERLLRERIHARFPDDAILGEGTRVAGRSGRRWIIDPIDGTRDFVRGNRFWCILIALEAEGEPVLGIAHFPALGDTVWAARGAGAHRNGERLRVSAADRFSTAVLSPNGLHAMAQEPYGPRMMEFMSRFWAVRSAGGALDAVMLAAGQVDVWLERSAEVWDLAPLQVIIEEAGGRFFAMDGSRRYDGGNAVACTPALEAEVRRFFVEARP
jgi:histidinol-phosphatase